MQIMIELEDLVYHQIKQHGEVSEFHKLIIHGTPLPKGHGDLVDVGQCNRRLFYKQCGGANSLITVKTAFDMLLSLPTIIEADRVESEGKE